MFTFLMVRCTSCKKLVELSKSYWRPSSNLYLGSRVVISGGSGVRGSMDKLMRLYAQRIKDSSDQTEGLGR
jgi:hypothetical protein